MQPPVLRPNKFFSCFGVPAVLFVLPSLLAVLIPLYLLPVRPANINPSRSAYPYLMTALGSDLYFFAETGHGNDDFSWQLYRAEGTQVTQVSNVYSDSGGISIPTLAPAQIGESVYFVVPAKYGYKDELWRTDGTISSTHIITDFGFPAAPHFSSWQSAGDYLYIVDSAGPENLWRTNGTSAGTVLLATGLWPFYAFYGSAGNAVYYAAQDPGLSGFRHFRASPSGIEGLTTNISGFEMGVVNDGDLYVADSTRLVRVKAERTDGEILASNIWDHQITSLHAAGGQIFIIDSNNPEYEDQTLWRFDPNTGATDRIGTYGKITAFGALGNAVYFSTSPREARFSGDSLLRLPKNSVTPEFVIRFGGGDHEVAQITANSQWLFLNVAYASARISQVWVSDGTPLGTRILVRTKNPYSMLFMECPCLTVAGDRPYFDKADDQEDIELWTVTNAPHSFFLPQIGR